MKQRAYMEQSARQNQTMIMSYAMHQAFKVLQMPVAELSMWLHSEIEQNPLLTPSSSKTLPYLDATSKEETLYHYLEREIGCLFSSEEEKKVATFIAGSLDRKGFLTISPEEICKELNLSMPFFQAVLSQFHTLEPTGLGAKNAQEALLLQLQAQKKQDMPLFLILQKHYDDFLHRRWHTIAKALSLSPSAIQKCVEKELPFLDPFPGLRFENEPDQLITFDLSIENEQAKWSVFLCDELLPECHIESFEKKEACHPFYRRHLASGKWLMRTLERRKSILLEIGHYLVKTEKLFFEGKEAHLKPLARREMALALNLSESTIARALQGKYVQTPRGLFALQDFFPYALHSDAGPISNASAKELLVKLIEEENKERPFSDQDLSQLLEAKGIPCARRTVAKYRNELCIGSKHKRKKWC